MPKKELTPEQREKKKAMDKIYYQNNKEKVKAREKIYYQNNKEKVLAKEKAYRENNPEKVKASNKLYRENNKEKENARLKLYYKNNQEKVKAREKIYKQTPAGIKSWRISRWKSRGIIYHDFDELYEIFLNTTHCEDCGIEFNENTKKGESTKYTRCIDHDHYSLEICGIVCVPCNTRRC